jgi:hypothetical protein
MLEMMQRVNWGEYLHILSQGSPPIGIQLLLLNVILIVYLLHRRTRHKSKYRQQSGWVVPVLFLAGNLGVVTWGSKLQF